MMQLPPERVYFPALTALRSIAMFMVLFDHLESFKAKAGLPNLLDYSLTHSFIDQLGAQGVKVFFVLSGFLITYLHLSELDQTNRIDVKKFYIRRILRILPLYFFIVFLGFFVLPYILNPDYFLTKTEPHFALKLLLMILLLPNLVFHTFGHIFAIGVLWSIGAEEQFYAVWPHLFNKFKKYLLPMLLVLLALVIGIKFSAYIIWQNAAHQWHWAIGSGLRILYLLLEYDCMVIGGLAAWLYYLKKSAVSGFIFKPSVQWLVYAVTLLLLWFNPALHAFTNLVYGSLYAVIILNLAANPASVLVLKNRFLAYTGQISYAMYMFHSIVIVAVIESIRYFWPGLGLAGFNLLLYALAIPLTFLIASLSWRFLERPVLRLKTKYAVVKSTHPD